MAITFPLSTDFLHDFPGWTLEFDLLWRQEQSRTAGGRTFVKDLGSPLWKMTAQSRPLQRPVLDYWKARFNVLENGFHTFRAFPKSRCYPIAYPGGSWPTGGSFSGITAAVNSINANRKAISLKQLPAGYTGKIGDYIQIGTGNLHQVAEDFTANGSGVTPQFEIRPHLWPLSAVNDAVSVYRPSCLMTLVPGSLSSSAELNGFGSINFQAVESR